MLEDYLNDFNLFYVLSAVFFSCLIVRHYWDPILKDCVSHIYIYSIINLQKLLKMMHCDDLIKFISLCAIISILWLGILYRHGYGPLFLT